MSEREEAAMRHLGAVLSYFAELDEDDRCAAFVDALEFYNRHNPDLTVVAEPGFSLTLVRTGPLDRMLDLPSPPKDTAHE